MVSPNPQPLKEFRNLLYYIAKVLALFLKLFFFIYFLYCSFNLLSS